MIYKTNYKPKKSLGQNFLKSEMALRKIVEAGEISKDDVILEIGPGKGKLTEKLLLARNASHSDSGGEKVHPSSGEQGKVIAVEKDRELFEFLKIKFAKEILEKKLILIQDDILNFNIQQNYKIIANIPYNITGAILKKFLTTEHQPERMILMIQHEVATRILARDKKESILSISVKAYGNPKMIMKVPARYFSPSPKVDSAVIAIKNISRKTFEENKIDEEKFWEIVKNGFAHKRKKLSGNLKNIISGEKLLSSGFKDKRAEDLSLSDWILLTKN